MLEYVDPFIGNSVTDLPVPQGFAETCWCPSTHHVAALRLDVAGAD